MTQATKTRKKRFSMRQKEALTGWIFLAPALIGFSIFTFGSILYSFYLSLTEWDLLTNPNFVGLKNFIKIFRDRRFYAYFGNTFYFVLFLVPIVFVISLLLSVLINRKTGKITTLYRVSLFLPSITSTIAISMVWLWILNPEMGLLNSLLRALGVQNPPPWIQSEAWSKPGLVIMRIWQMSGYYMIMFLAGLKTIPDSLFESAEVEGANVRQKFFHITLPMLSNTTFIVIILLIIEAFNMFESIYVMTLGGPNGSTSTIMYYIYERAFKFYQMGYASALAWVFFLVVFLVSLIQYRLRNEQDGE